MTRKGPIRGFSAALLGTLLLTACGNSDSSQFADTIVKSFTGGGKPGPQPTRDDLNAVPYAVVAVRRTGAKRPSYLGAITNNDGYITYYSPGGRSLTFHGGAITSHHGIGHDLVGSTSSPGDPLVTPTPLADWPVSVDRAYQLRGGDGAIYTRSVVCTPIRGEAEKLEIMEITFDVVAVEDRCRNGELSFKNRYWVDPASGFIWKSVQWTGPSMFSITVEVIKPYAGSSGKS